MSSVIALTNTFKKEFLNPFEIFIIACISFFYFSFTILLLNFNLSINTLFSNNLITYKYNLISALVFGANESLGSFDQVLLLLTSILVGTNIVVVSKNIKRLRNSGGKLVLNAGGGAILGIFVAGCSTCGFSVFALFGLTSAVSLFPFEGTIIGVIIFLLLIISTIYSLNTLSKDMICEIK